MKAVKPVDFKSIHLSCISIRKCLDLSPMEEKERHELASRILELAQKTARDGYLTHTPFLSMSEQSVLYDVLKENHESELTHTLFSVPYLWFGGHEDADRKILFFLPYYESKELSEEDKEKTISLLQITPKNKKFADTLTHRDYLGALMHLGLDRSVYGDILTDGSEGYLYVLSSVSEIVQKELGKVKHTVVDCKEVPLSSCPLKPRFEEKAINVASNRLDCVIGEVYHLSRKDAQILITSENVFLNGKTMKSNAYLLKGQERISIAGKGKFIYLGEGKTTKKGRLFVHVKIYE